MEKTEHNLPYFPCYVADWLIDTQDLTDEQDGAYFRLVRYQWKHGSIPNDIKIMRRISDSIDEAWPVIGKFFKEDENGNLINGRTDRERQKIVSKIKAGSKGGSKSTSKTPSKDASKSTSETPSKDASKSTSETDITQSSEPITTELKTQNTELSNIISFFPNGFFHNMTIPNILLGVQEKHGNDALRAVCEKVALIVDKKKLTGPYIRTMIKNMDLAGIAKGLVSKSGDVLEHFTRIQCADMALKSGSKRSTDELYRALKDDKGNNIKFEDGHRYAGESVWVKKD